jgi:hypothetical protein
MTTIDITLSPEILEIAEREAKIRQVTVEDFVAEIITKLGSDALAREASVEQAPVATHSLLGKEIGTTTNPR